MFQNPFAFRAETLREEHGLTLAGVADGTLLVLNDARDLVVLGENRIVSLSAEERALLQPIITYVDSVSPPTHLN